MNTILYMYFLVVICLQLLHDDQHWALCRREWVSYLFANSCAHCIGYDMHLVARIFINTVCAFVEGRPLSPVGVHLVINLKLLALI